MNFTINTKITKLHSEGIISKQSLEFLQKNNVVDAFDVMTTEFPENSPTEITKLINQLYKEL